MIVHFKSPEHSFLSNFELVSINYCGINYPSVEHAFMSAKSDDPQWKAYCSNTNISPADVKREGKTIQFIHNWKNIKLTVMENCLRSKFHIEPYKTLLIETGNQNIQEGNWWGDKYWGVDLKQDPNIGENHLGRLLMVVREELQTNKFCDEHGNI